MISETYEVSTFQHLHDRIQDIAAQHGKQKSNTVYRGHKSIHYKLQPKVGRIEKFRFSKLKVGAKNRSSLLDQERRILEMFKERALPLLPRAPDTDWEWLAIGQHHGLATRLLDWSKNPLVAAYFAVEEEYDEESAVYVFNRGFFRYEGQDPFEINGVKRITPAFYTRRIEVQSGVFTVHSDPKKPLEETAQDGSLHKIIIAKSFRTELKRTLSEFGIHRASMFPDLDGMAFYVNNYLVRSWE